MHVFYWSMASRPAALFLLAAASLLALGGSAMVSFGTAQTEAPHISFVLATGSTGGTYFPVGQAIAQIISHPPGAARCDVAPVCGPAGLIASTRSSLGSVANVLDVNAGRVDSGLAQSDILAEAVAGKGEFHKTGPQSHVRVIADLFPEEVHLVAAPGAKIKSATDLKGKRVAIGPVGSGTAGIAHEILAAWRVSEKRVTESDDTPDVAAQRLARGEIDAFFFVGGAPVTFIRDLVASGKAELVPLDGAGRKRLVTNQPGLSAETIAASDYPTENAAIETVGVHAIWIVNDREAPTLVYDITKAMFSPANRAQLDAAHPSARAIRPETATQVLPAPLHPGAAQFYREISTPTRSDRHS